MGRVVFADVLPDLQDVCEFGGGEGGGDGRIHTVRRRDEGGAIIPERAGSRVSVKIEINRPTSSGIAVERESLGHGQRLGWERIRRDGGGGLRCGDNGRLMTSIIELPLAVGP